MKKYSIAFAFIFSLLFLSNQAVCSNNLPRKLLAEFNKEYFGDKQVELDNHFDGYKNFKKVIDKKDINKITYMSIATTFTSTFQVKTAKILRIETYKYKIVEISLIAVDSKAYGRWKTQIELLMETYRDKKVEYSTNLNKGNEVNELRIFRYSDGNTVMTIGFNDKDKSVQYGVKEKSL